MLRILIAGSMLAGAAIVMPSAVSAQSAKSAAEEANDSSQQERSFEETRKHMQTHSEWSKKTGKMNNN